MSELKTLENELQTLESKKNKNANDLIKIKQLVKKIKKFNNEDENKSTGAFVHTNTIENIDIDSIEPNPYQPRKIFNDSTIDSLAESIAEEGLIQPITVIKTKTGFTLVTGERRFKACKKLGENTIKAIIDNNYTLKDLKLKAIIENLAREDLCLADEAVSIKSLNSSGLSYSNIASKVAKSKTHISRMMNISMLSEESLGYIRTNNMKQTNSIEIIATSSKNDDEKLELLEALKEKELTYQHLKNILNKKESVPTRNTLKIESPIDGIKALPLNLDNKKMKIELDFSKLNTLDKDSLYEFIQDIKEKVR